MSQTDPIIVQIDLGSGNLETIGTSFRVTDDQDESILFANSALGTIVYMATERFGEKANRFAVRCNPELNPDPGKRKTNRYLVRNARQVLEVLDYASNAALAEAQVPTNPTAAPSATITPVPMSARQKMLAPLARMVGHLLDNAGELDEDAERLIAELVISSGLNPLVRSQHDRAFVAKDGLVAELAEKRAEGLVIRLQGLIREHGDRLVAEARELGLRATLPGLHLECETSAEPESAHEPTGTNG